MLRVNNNVGEEKEAGDHDMCRGVDEGGGGGGEWLKLDGEGVEKEGKM